MAEQEKPFVINDRRKFRLDGEPRETSHDSSEHAAPESTASPAANDEHTESRGRVIPFGDPHRHAESTEQQGAQPTTNDAHLITPVPEPDSVQPAESVASDPALPTPPTPEEIEQVRKAYDATAERLDTVMRATNPGAEHLPPMDFTRLVQSIYMSAMMQLGAGTPQGEQPRVDLLGAKQSIDMLGVLGDRTSGNLSTNEIQLLDSALFELRMGFLEITQLLARQAASKGAPGTPGRPGTPSGPRIVT